MGRRVAIAVLLLAALAAALEPVYFAGSNTIFLPLAGIALNLRSGKVRWRFPRFEGQTYSDGNGLLLVSWDNRFRTGPFQERHFTRVCRLRVRDGAQLWCRNWGNNFGQVEHWTVDGSGQLWYLYLPGRMYVLRLDNGKTITSFALPPDDEVSLAVLPGTGVALLDRRRRSLSVRLYHPGASALVSEPLPPSSYPFRGNGRGLLFYAQKAGSFFLADPLREIFHQPTERFDFPLAKLNGKGFVFTDGSRPAQTLRGGTYAGKLWQAPLPPGDAHLAVSNGLAFLLTSNPDGHSRLQAWELATGKLRFSLRLAGAYTSLACADNTLVLQGRYQLALLTADSGHRWWEAALDAGTLAAITPDSVIFWQANNELVAFSRRRFHLLWRVLIHGRQAV